MNGHTATNSMIAAYTGDGQPVVGKSAHGAKCVNHGGNGNRDEPTMRAKEDTSKAIARKDGRASMAKRFKHAERFACSRTIAAFVGVII